MKKILIISDINFAPQNEGNKKRIYDIIQIYKECGLIVSFLFVPKNGSEKISQHDTINGNIYVVQRTLGDKLSFLFSRAKKIIGSTLNINFLMRYKIDEWAPIGAIKKSTHIINSYDTIQCEYAYMSKFLDNSAAKLKIIDTHDVFSNRAENIASHGGKTTWFSIKEAEEKILLERSNKILAISKSDGDFFKQITQRNVYILDFISKPKYCWSRRSEGIIFIGSNNRMNLNGINWFFEHVHPILLSRGFKKEIFVAGKITPDVKHAGKYKKIGFVESLDDLLSKCEVMINPVDIGTGIPIKNIDALSRGIPIIATNNAARGCEKFYESGMYIAENSIDFAEKIISLTKNKNITERASLELFKKYEGLYNESLEKISKEII